MITNSINSNAYIGITNNPKNRWAQHKNPEKAYKHLHMYRSMDKYGNENFYMNILEEHDTEESVKQAEIDVIKMFKDTGVSLFNVSAGGDGCIGYKHSEEAKKKISARFKGQPKSPEHIKKMSDSRSGDKHPNFGKKLSQSTIDKMVSSAAQEKPVISISLDGEIKEYKSVSACGRSLNISSGRISAVIKGKRRQSKGYTFKYKELN